MPGAIGNIFVMVAAGKCLVGGFTNGFIVLVNFMDWVKTGRLSSLDLILTALATSRIILMGSFACMVIVINFFIFHEMIYLESIWNLSNHLNTWFDTCLSVFYFPKISNFSHPAFLWLKWRVNKVVFRMVCICFLVTLLVDLLLAEKITISTICVAHGNRTNGTHETQITKEHHFFNLILYYMGGFVPFIFSLISCLLLVFSLWKHSQQMQGNVTNCRDSGTEVHKKTMKSIVSFLFLFLLYHVSIVIGTSSYILLDNPLLVLFSMIITAIYPLAHSIILIKLNNKLRQASLRILWQLRHCPQRIWERLCGTG
ncbi:LOW QUALITY PROTEIN: taste receptor type 2 member 7-like [Phascolarctos cinereus]|uniref:Taste receptor type 2 n=1 Tax=Phascolarctos cinereus TaxID=38626 RepID=A0A6P5J0C6_PHACI|nr:LOW QUALITY PROTEIN: taste receptor type 2 member 7-like [Phascolarctos cinereus]